MTVKLERNTMQGKGNTNEIPYMSNHMETCLKCKNEYFYNSQFCPKCNSINIKISNWIPETLKLNMSISVQGSA